MNIVIISNKLNLNGNRIITAKIFNNSNCLNNSDLKQLKKGLFLRINNNNIVSFYPQNLQKIKFNLNKIYNKSITILDLTI